MFRKKLQQEIENFPEVTPENIAQMQYLKQVINETVRLLAPWAARFPTEPATIGEFHIQPNTPVIQALGVCMVDPNLWERADEFDPSRFSQESSKNRDTLQFVPFGFAGGRVCPGMSYFNTLSSVVIFQVIKNFNLVLDKDHPPVVAVHGLVTQPKEEIFLTLERRQ